MDNVMYLLQKNYKAEITPTSSHIHNLEMFTIPQENIILNLFTFKVMIPNSPNAKKHISVFIPQ